jgi:hypothetical protein
VGKRRVRLDKSAHRVHLEFRPTWAGSVRAWTLSYLRRNKWRFDPIHDIDDLLQDAYCVFARVAERYPRVVEAPHFMALYKTALFNEMCDASSKNSKRKTVIADLEVDGCELAEKMTCNLAEDGAMSLLLASAPPEVRLLLSAFSSERHLLEMRKPYRKHRGLPRDSFNTRIKKLLGIESDADLVGCFREWLAP